MYKSAYSEIFLEELVKKIKKVKAAEAWIYFNNTWGTAAIENAKFLQKINTGRDFILLPVFKITCPHKLPAMAPGYLISIISHKENYGKLFASFFPLMHQENSLYYHPWLYKNAKVNYHLHRYIPA